VEQGEFTRALAERRRAADLGAGDPGWREESQELLRDCERLLALDRRLPAVLKGEQPPAPGGRLGFARVCRARGLFAAAAGFYHAAFEADPRLADDAATGGAGGLSPPLGRGERRAGAVARLARRASEGVG
jgi:hypothetical protein